MGLVGKTRYITTLRTKKIPHSHVLGLPFPIGSLHSISIMHVLLSRGKFWASLLTLFMKLLIYAWKISPFIIVSSRKLYRTCENSWINSLRWISHYVPKNVNFWWMQGLFLSIPYLRKWYKLTKIKFPSLKGSLFLKRKYMSVDSMDWIGIIVGSLNSLVN